MVIMAISSSVGCSVTHPGVPQSLGCLVAHEFAAVQGQSVVELTRGQREHLANLQHRHGASLSVMGFTAVVPHLHHHSYSISSGASNAFSCTLLYRCLSCQGGQCRLPRLLIIIRASFGPTKVANNGPLSGNYNNCFRVYN